MAEVPPERRIYIKPEDVPKYQKLGVTVYQGPKGGHYIDRQELKSKGSSMSELGLGAELGKYMSLVFRTSNGKCVVPEGIAEYEGNPDMVVIGATMLEFVDCSKIKSFNVNELFRSLDKLKREYKESIEYELEHLRDFESSVEDLKRLAKSPEELEQIKEYILGHLARRLDSLFSSHNVKDYLVGVRLYNEIKKKYPEFEYNVPEMSVEQFYELFNDILERKVFPDKEILKEYIAKEVLARLNGKMGTYIMEKFGIVLSDDEIADIVVNVIDSIDELDIRKLSSALHTLDIARLERIGTFLGVPRATVKSVNILEVDDFAKKFREVLRRKLDDSIVKLVEGHGGDVLDLVSPRFRDMYSYIRKLEKGYSVNNDYMYDFSDIEVYDPGHSIDLPEVSIEHDENGRIIVKENGKVTARVSGDDFGNVTDVYVGETLGSLVLAWKVNSSSNQAAVLEHSIARVLGEKGKYMREYKEEYVQPEKEEIDWWEAREKYSRMPYNQARYEYSKSISLNDVSDVAVKRLIALNRALLDKEEYVLYRGLGSSETKQVIEFLLSDKNEEVLDTYYLTAFSGRLLTAQEFNKDVVLMVRASKNAIVFHETLVPDSRYYEHEFVLRNPSGMKITKANILIPNFDEYDNRYVGYNEEKCPLSVAHFWYVIGRRNKDLQKKVKNKILKYENIIKEKIKYESYVSKREAEHWKKILEEVKGW